MVSAAVTALLKITVGHLVVPYSFAIWEQKSDKTVIDVLVYCCFKKKDIWNSVADIWVINILIFGPSKDFKMSFMFNLNHCTL